MRRRVACSARPLPRSASALSVTPAIGERLGRNARFASIGNGLAAAAMGACGYFFSARAVFIVTVLLARTGAAGAAQHRRGRNRSGARPRRGAAARADKPPTKPGDLMHNRPLLIFAGCLLLFHLANAAMLPLMGSVVTMRSSAWATILIAACIVVPQLVVAALSPWVGRRAQIWGRRPLLLIGFAALPIRGLAVRIGHRPGAAGRRADPRRHHRGRVRRDGAARWSPISRAAPAISISARASSAPSIGIGASLSATLAGYMTDHFGSPVGVSGPGRDRARSALRRLWLPDAGNPAGPMIDASPRRSRGAPGRFGSASPTSYSAGASSATSRRCGAMPSDQAAVDREIVLRHAARGEALLEALPDFLARQMRQPIDGADRAVLVLDDEAGQRRRRPLPAPSRD